MKVKTISYAKVFPIAPYENQKIGVEIELDETDGFDETFEYAKELVHKWAKVDDTPTWASNASYKVGTPFEYDSSKISAPPPLQSIDPKKRDETEIAIDNCFLVEDLYKLKDAAVANGIVSHYERKLNHLQQFP
jgi:hypothetical protein